MGPVVGDDAVGCPMKQDEMIDEEECGSLRSAVRNCSSDNVFRKIVSKDDDKSITTRRPNMNGTPEVHMENLEDSGGRLDWFEMAEWLGTENIIPCT